MSLSVSSLATGTEWPIRQWVLSLPFWLRYRVAYDHKLLTEIIAVWSRTVTNFCRKRAREQHGIADGHCAAISAVQRFGDRRCSQGLKTRRRTIDVRSKPTPNAESPVTATLSSLTSGSAPI